MTNPSETFENLNLEGSKSKIFDNKYVLKLFLIH